MALEMAAQLRAHGEDVPLVALFDPLFIRYTRRIMSAIAAPQNALHVSQRDQLAVTSANNLLCIFASPARGGEMSLSFSERYPHSE
jgi:hypothetical protein